MALTRCKECKAEVSTKAKTCPKCGAPVQKHVYCLSGCLIIAVVFIVLPILVGEMHKQSKRPDNTQPSTSAAQNSPSTGGAVGGGGDSATRAIECCNAYAHAFQEQSGEAPDK